MFKKKTVAEIVKGFTKIKDQLEKHVEDMAMTANSIRASISALTIKQIVAEDEIQRAEVISRNLAKLLEE